MLVRERSYRHNTSYTTHEDQTSASSSIGGILVHVSNSKIVRTYIPRELQVVLILSYRQTIIFLHILPLCMSLLKPADKTASTSSSIGGPLGGPCPRRTHMRLHTRSTRSLTLSYRQTNTTYSSRYATHQPAPSTSSTQNITSKLRAHWGCMLQEDP